jgi:predicted DNA-binding transcriptional regulator YafY
VWYLVAGTDHGMRTFRVNRVRAVERTGDPVERPPGFDLAATWRTVVETIEEKRTAARAVVRVPPWGAAALRGQFGASTRIVAERPDGRLDVEVGAPTNEHLAQLLAGWSEHLEVIGPEQIRDQLAAIGTRLVARYGRRMMTDVTAVGSSVPGRRSE